MRYIKLLAKLVQTLFATDTQALFQRSGCVVESGVNDFTVTAAGFCAKVCVFFQQQYGTVLAEFISTGKANDAAADDAVIEVCHRLKITMMCPRRAEHRI